MASSEQRGTAERGELCIAASMIAGEGRRRRLGQGAGEQEEDSGLPQRPTNRLRQHSTYEAGTMQEMQRYSDSSCMPRVGLEVGEMPEGD